MGTTPRGMDVNGKIVNKQMLSYRVKKNVVVLKSTAKAIKDTWSTKETIFQSEGGGTQYFSADKNAFEVLGNE